MRHAHQCWTESQKICRRIATTSEPTITISNYYNQNNKKLRQHPNRNNNSSNSPKRPQQQQSKTIITAAIKNVRICNETLFRGNRAIPAAIKSPVVTAATITARIIEGEALPTVLSLLGWTQLHQRLRHRIPFSLAANNAKLTCQHAPGSLGLMVAGRAKKLKVPFSFNELVYSPLRVEEVTSAAVATDTAEDLSVAACGPAFVLPGYRALHAAAPGSQEGWNAVFAHVAQNAIRKVGRIVSDRVPKLDMQFHLGQNTGQLSHILDRGQHTISVVLNTMVFYVALTISSRTLQTLARKQQFPL